MRRGAWLCSGGPAGSLHSLPSPVVAAVCSFPYTLVGPGNQVLAGVLGLTACRFAEDGGSCRLECTATILPGRAGAGARSNSSSALLDVKPKYVMLCCLDDPCCVCQQGYLQRTAVTLTHTVTVAATAPSSSGAPAPLWCVLSLVVCLCAPAAAVACWPAAGRSAGGRRCPAGA